MTLFTYGSVSKTFMDEVVDYLEKDMIWLCNLVATCFGFACMRQKELIF